MNKDYRKELLEIVCERSGETIEEGRLDFLIIKVKALILATSLLGVRLDGIASFRDDSMHDEIDSNLQEFLFLRSTKEKVDFLINSYGVDIFHRTDPKPDTIKEGNLYSIDYDKAKEQSLETDYIALVGTISGFCRRGIL